MSDEMVDVRVLLAGSPTCASNAVAMERWTCGWGRLTRHADHGTGKDLSTMLARMISRIGAVADKSPVPNLLLIRGGRSRAGEA